MLCRSVVKGSHTALEDFASEQPSRTSSGARIRDTHMGMLLRRRVDWSYTMNRSLTP